MYWRYTNSSSILLTAQPIKRPTTTFVSMVQYVEAKCAPTGDLFDLPTLKSCTPNLTSASLEKEQKELAREHSHHFFILHGTISNTTESILIKRRAHIIIDYTQIASTISRNDETFTNIHISMCHYQVNKCLPRIK